MRVVLTAGHVDHGKSTLVRTLTGMEPDRWDEERRRGLTIDLGFVWTTLAHAGGELTVAFVDVPGHHRFVPNMLAGAGAVQDAIFVVAADDGWSAQSTEHLTILDLLDVRGVAVAVTKADSVGADRLDDVMAQVQARLAGTSMAAPVLAVDSITGRGIDEFRSQLLARLSSEVSPPEGDARLWVDRSFTIAGAGTVVTGTLQGGPLHVGQELRLAPSQQSVRIRGLQALGQPVDHAPAGSRVAVNLARVSPDEVGRGHALVTGEWAATNTVYLQLRSVADRPISHRGSWTLHAGTAETPVSLRPLLGPVNPEEQAPVWARLEDPLPLRTGDPVIVRSTGAGGTQAGGRVLDPQPPPRPRGSLARLETAEILEELAHSTQPPAQTYWLLRLHEGVLSRRQLARALGPIDDIAVETSTWLSGLLVDDTTLADWEAEALDVVDQADQQYGAALRDVTTGLARAGCPATHHKALISRMTQAGRLDGHGDILTRPEHSQTYLQARARRRDHLLEAFSVDPFTPPDLHQQAQQLGIPSAELQSLFDDGTLVQIEGVAFTAQAVVLAHERLAATHGHQGFTASDARTAWGTTRKFAIPLLEHLSRTGTTTFDGELHHLV